MRLFVSLLSGVFVFDFLTKFLVRTQLVLGQEIELLPFFSLVHVQNTGVAFGLFQGKNLLFLALGTIVVGTLIFLAIRSLVTDPTLSWILAIIIGGALGNLLDRVRFGRVIDFLDFYIGAHHWPAFNVADSAICIGAFLMIIQGFRKPKFS